MITMARTQYESLLQAAKGDQAINVDQLSRDIDRANNITRYQLYIRWLETRGSTSVPFSIREGNNWPPTQFFLLTLDRPITREDVDDVVRTQATNPVDVQVTRDPNGLFGLTEIDSYDFQSNAS